MPGVLSKEVAALDNLQTQIRDVAELGYVRGEFEDFTGAQKHARVGGRDAIIVLGCFLKPGWLGNCRRVVPRDQPRRRNRWMRSFRHTTERAKPLSPVIS